MDQLEWLIALLLTAFSIEYKDLKKYFQYADEDMRDSKRTQTNFHLVVGFESVFFKL